MTGLEVLDESLHGGTDVRFSEALQEHLALGAGVSNRRRPRGDWWWNGRWGGGASTTPKSSDGYGAGDNVHQGIDHDQ